jgi:hypothetical protein
MFPKKPMNHGLSREEAEALAARAFAYLAADPERIGRFLSLTGLTPESVRGATQAPAFLPAVLDHLANDEALLLAFSAESGIEPPEIAMARQALGENSPFSAPD